MDVFALNLRLKEEGASTVQAAVDKLRRSFDSASTGAGKMDTALDKLKGGLRDLATLAAAQQFFGKIITETSAAQFAQAQLAAALQSTGNAAGQTISAMNAHAEALQDISTFGDDAVSEAQALLLTFTKVGGETFPRATEAIVDLATGLKTDLRSATIQLGKALNDPIKGVTALGRAGVQFSDAQKQMIARLVETNQLAKAQAVILQEVETQFKGSAEAAGNTLGGALARLSNAFGNLFEMTTDTSSGFVSLINGMIAGLKALDGAIAGFVGGIKLMAVDAGIAFEKIKGWATMTGPEYRNLLATLEAYREEAYKTIVGLGDEVTVKTRQQGEAFAGTGEKIKTQVELMKELAAVTTISQAEANVLIAEQDRLTLALQAGNIPLAKKVELATQLKDVTDSLAGATVRMTGSEMDSLMRNMGKAIGTPVQAVVGPQIKVPKIAPSVIAQVQANASQMATAMKSTYLDEMTSMSMDLAIAIRDILVDSVALGIETAIATGNVGEGFKAMTKALLAGLGGMLIQFGKSLIPVGALMAKIRTALLTLSPQGIVAAGIGMIAVGAALRGAAQAAFGGSAAGAGTAASIAPSLGTTGGTMTLGGLTYGPTAAGSAATIQRVNPVSVTIIGPNDPAAQRQMQELITNANRRGSV